MNDDIEKYGWNRSAFKEKLKQEIIAHPPAPGYGAREFLRQNTGSEDITPDNIREAITLKLLEIANCGTKSIELRALEMLGKHADIRIFEDKSQKDVTYEDVKSLESAIQNKISVLKLNKQKANEPTRSILKSNNPEISDVEPLKMQK